jgi:histidinol-phosphate aminotransferase
MAKTAEKYDTDYLDFPWQHPEFDRLMANECPLPPSPAVMRAIASAAATGNLYPPSDRELREAIGRFAGVPPESIVVGHGSGEIIDLITRVLVGPGDEAILPSPGYGYFVREVRIYQGTPVFVPLGEGWTFDVPAILAAITERTKLIFLCSPNNPTGNSWTEQEVRAVLDAGIPTIMDQAYLECGHSPSFAHLVSSYRNLIVTRTFSKGFGLAGLRVGYGIGDPWLTNLLHSVRPPFTVSLVSLRASTTAVNDPEELERHRQYISAERDRLYEGLKSIRGVVPYASDGNFILFDVGGTGMTAVEVVAAVREHQILIRPMTSHGLGQRHARVTVGTHERNTRFLEVLAEIVRASGQVPIAAV